VHGIGIGLYPYIDFLAELNMENSMNESDGEVGIIAVEIMSVSFRITSEALEKEEMCQEIDCILKEHSWEKFVLVSHS
jgi:predicted ferric reductase